MPDLRQALKDFVATSNSGKYTDDEVLLSKFPELKGYDIQTLKDFVATSNSGKYATEDEIFSKFPEFNIGAVPSKKKFGSELTSQEADVESTSKPTQQNTSLGTNQQKTIKETTPAVTKQVQPTEEEDYFTGGFGNFLRGVDDIIPLGIGDFVDDMARGVASGYRQGQSAKASGNLIVSGTNPSDEEITQFIESRKSAEEIKPSDEMNNYQKIYQEEGKGFWGVVKGLVNNPTVIPELLLSSLTSMATNTDAIKAGVSTIIAGGSIGAATGATGGSVVPVVGTGIGAGAGAIAGAEAAIPFAFGAASAVVEMGSTFGELLQEELGDKEMSKENVRAVLENPEKMQSIRNKAIARGLVIGTIDAFTGKLATGVGAKILTKSAAKSATGAVTKAAATKAVAAGAAVESFGGSFGETAARTVIGQDMDISEIALEGLAELPGGIRSTIQAKFAKPSYRVNGEKVTAEDIDELTRTMTPEQLYATKIVIKNDYEGRMFRIQDKVVTNSIKEDVRKANPELNEPSLNAITQLEKDLQGLEGNKTQTGKDKASAIRAQIKNIQENQLQDEAASEYIINDKKYSKEDFLKELEGKTPDELKAIKIAVNNDEQTAKNINEKFKTDAVQEQSTTEVPIQSETTTSETMEGGTPQSESEVVTKEEVKDFDLTIPENTDNIIVSDSSNGFILVDSDTNQPIEVFNDNAGENSGISKPYATQEEAQARIEELKVQPTQEIDLGLGLEENPLRDVEATDKALFDMSQNEESSADFGPEAKPVKEQWEIDYERRKAKLDEFNAENRPSALEDESEGRNEFKILDRQNSEERSKLKQNVFDAQENISRTDDADAAIEEYNKKKKELQDFDNETQNMQNVRDVNDLIYNEIEYKEKDGDTYEFPEEFNKDPREAALKRTKEMLDFLNERNNENDLESIERYKNNVKILEKDIKENPLKENTFLREEVKPEAAPTDIVTEVAPTETTTETAPEVKPIDAAIKTLQESKEYIEADDIQKEALVRATRKEFGLKEKSAPSVNRLFGKLKDIAKITITEKAGLIKQIKDTAKGAREAVKAFKLASQQLTKDIKELKESGKITSTQLANVLVKFSKVNVLNDASVSNFVDYMTKVFTDADYINKIETAKSNLKTAKKNIVTKLGIADGLILPLQRLFAINPTMIPDAYLGKYLGLVDMFGKRQAVLTLEEKSQTIKDVQEILDEINNERSLVDELADRFNNSDNKVFKDDKLDYSASLNKMLEEGEIENEDLALMKKYKTDIVPQVEKSKLTEEEIQAEKDELVELIKKSKIDGTELSTKDERDLSKELNSLIKGKAINELTNVELKNLLKVIDNINNGYLPHYTQLLVEKLNSINNAVTLETAVNKSKPLPLSKLYAKAKSILTKKDAMLEMIRRNPLFNIDQVLGDFKTKDIFNSLFNKAAEAEAKFTSELKNVQSLLEKAEEKVAKSFKLNANKTLMSKFKMMTYMVQLEHDSNPDNKQVNPASEYLKATIKHIEAGKSQFGERDSDMLQEIYDKYTDSEGNIDNEKLFNSFNDAEKEAIKTVRSINESLKEKAEYTGAIIRGQKINPLNNYVHLNVLHEYKPNDLASGDSFANDYNNSMRPSTKAKSLIERTGKVSPLNFDIFTSAQRGAKFVLMDYHLTEPIRTARKTMNRTISNMEGKGKIPKEKRQIVNAINNAFEETVDNLITNNYTETSFGDDVANYVSKQGYRAVLAGTGRFASEFLSNVGFVLLSDPTAFTEGIKNTGLILSADAPAIMNNVNSKETNRIFPTDTLSGRMIDSNIINQASGIKGNKSKNVVANKIQQIFNLSGKKYVNSVELLSDILISTPDKAIMRPIWFGSFAYNFKKITGTEVDFKKIAANDETYMDQNKEALEKAKTIADERSVITGSSNNAFTGILKGTSKPNQSITTKAFNNFNSFMTKFMVYEFVTARTGIMAAMGNGSLTKKQGVALLGAAVTRMTVYSLLIKALGSGIIGLLFDDDDDEEDKKAPEKAVGQALASTFSSMLLGRDFGNISKTIINYGVEQVNENYLDFLREGDYDPYKDALQYSVVTPEKKGTQTGVYDLFKNMTGSYGPAIKTADLVLKKAFEDEKQDAAAIERQEKEKNIRIPLEVLGNLGLVPLYKEIRKSVIKDIYKKTLQEKQEEQAKIDMFQEQLDKAVTPEDIDIATEALNRVKNPKLYEAEKETIKNMKESLLTNEETGITYDNISDVKKYDRPLWEKNFGPDSEWYQVTKGEREVEKLIKQKETEAEEEKFNYVKPKRKSKNSDGTYKKSSSSRSRVKGFGGSSSSSSSSTTERYDSRGVKITTKKSRSRVKGFN